MWPCFAPILQQANDLTNLFHFTCAPAHELLLHHAFILYASRLVPEVWMVYAVGG
jgi:hypothetical protein